MRFSDRKFIRVTAGILACGMLLSVCAGCRSSGDGGSALSSLEEDSNWADLTETETPVSTPTPSTTTYLPELAGDGDELGEDVTADYQTAFLGTWVDEQSIDWEFRSSGVLVLTTEATGATENWSYCFRMQGKIPVLVVTKDGTEQRYSFTLTSKNLTLYDPDSGNAQALLSKVTEEPKVSAPVQSAEPTATPTATPTAQPTAQAASAPAMNESEPADQPEEQQSEEQQPAEQQPAEQQTEASEQPAEEPDQTQTEESGDLDDILPDAVKVETENLPGQYQNATPVLKRVMGAVLDMGLSFNKDDPKSFWGILAYYFAAATDKGAISNNRYTVTAEAVETAAKDIFADYSQAPEPDGMYCTGNDDGSYSLLLGNEDALELAWYMVDGSYVIQVDGQDAYSIAVNDDGAVISVTPFAAE